MNEEELNFKKYEILINARNFHYDNFSKWMTYFYIAIGALGVAYTSLHTSEKVNFENFDYIEYLILTLSYITSNLWYYSNKGYYFWNINFITLINHYESTVLKWENGKGVYSIFANKDTENYICYPHRGANLSTSKIAVFFAFCVTVFWGILLLTKLISRLQCTAACMPLVYILAVVFSIIFTCLLGAFAQKWLKSNIDPLYNLGIVQQSKKNSE